MKTSTGSSATLPGISHALARARRAWEWLTWVNSQDPLRRALNRGMAAVIAVMTVFNALNLWVVLTTGERAYVIAAVSLFPVLVIAWWLNRAGTTLGTWFVVFLITNNIVILVDPFQWVTSMTPMVLIVPAILATLFIRPVAGLWTVGLLMTGLAVRFAFSGVPRFEALRFLAIASIVLISLTAFLMTGALMLRRALQALQRRADEFAQLYDTAHELATRQDAAAVLRAIGESTKTLLGGKEASVFFYDAEREELELAATTSTRGAPLGTRVALGEDISGHVARTRAPLIVNDYASWERSAKTLEDSELRAALAVPMLSGGELIGVLASSAVGSDTRPYSEADERLLSLFAAQAASAVRTTQLLEETRRRAGQFATLYDTAEALAQKYDVPTLLAEIVERVRVLMGGDKGIGVMLYDAGRDDLVAAASTPKAPLGTRLALGEGVTGRVAQTRQPMMVNAYQGSGLEVERYRHFGMRAILAVPLIASGDLVGVLSAASVQSEARPFNEDDMRLLSLFASHAAYTIRNARLLEETRHRAEELAASEARIRRLVDANIIGIVIANAEGDIFQANDAFLRIIGYTRQEFEAGEVRWTELMPSEPAAATPRAVDEAVQVGHATYEKEYVRKDGTRVPVLIGVARFDVPSGESVAFVLDLSERHARQAAEAASRAKSEFLAHMNHELRSPLNVVLGFTRLLERREFPPEVKKDLEIILNSGEHLLSLINQVLDLSKLEAGRAARNDVCFDLYQQLDNLQDIFKLKAKEKGIEFLSERRFATRYICADQMKLRQVLINLLSNAIKFTDRGSVMLNVETTADAPGGRAPDRLVFAVTDTGLGMNTNEMARLFTPFTQTAAGAKAQEGTGLGLALSKSFVELMGGEIHVDSIPGRGTTVRFDVPLIVATADDVALPAVDRRVVGLAPHQPAYRLLVVDDNADARLLLMRLLAPFRFELREASNGFEAVETWSAWHPQLIWMDLRMPVMDGRDATRRIRAAGDKSTRIVAVTASSFEEERAEVMSAGFDDFLRKPYREEDILAFLEKHLGVSFVYQKEEKPRDVALDADALKSLPDDLRESLAAALIQLDVAAVNRAVEEIRAQQPEVADKLSVLADEFQYERILRLLAGNEMTLRSLVRARPSARRSTT